MAARLTSVPGASAVFQGAVVSYADAVKVGQLGVAPSTLAEHGAVSAETAAEMAAGVRARLGVDVGVAVTGIAGPDGGTEEKPVGTVCWSVRLADGRAITRTVRLPGDRADIRDRSTTVAMHLLHRLLSE